MVKSASDVRIMIVDDCSTCLYITTAMLKKLNYKAVTAKSGADALSTLRTKCLSIDLVITDVHMPSMDGLELMDHVSTQFQLPVILVSGDQKNGIVHQGLKKGAYKFLIKPVKLYDLENLWKFAITTPKLQPAAAAANKIPLNIPPANNHNHTNNNERFAYSTRTLLRNSWSRHADQQVRRTLAALSDGFMTRNDDRLRLLSRCSKRKFPDYKGDSQLMKDKYNRNAVQKKPKVVWTTALHGRFLEALRFIGYDKAVPKKILEYMKVPGLTRENIASHLQKYRIYLKRLADPKYAAGSRSKMRAWNPMNSKMSIAGVPSSSISSTKTLPPPQLQSSSSSIVSSSLAHSNNYGQIVRPITTPSTQPAVNMSTSTHSLTLLPSPRQGTLLLPYKQPLSNLASNRSNANKTHSISSGNDRYQLGENLPTITTHGNTIQGRDNIGLLQLLEQKQQQTSLNFSSSGGYRVVENFNNNNNTPLPGGRSLSGNSSSEYFPSGLQVIGNQDPDLRKNGDASDFRIAFNAGGCLLTNNMINYNNINTVTDQMMIPAASIPVPSDENANNNVTADNYGHHQLGQNTYQDVYIPQSVSNMNNGVNVSQGNHEQFVNVIQEDNELPPLPPSLDFETLYGQIDLSCDVYEDIFGSAILDDNFLLRQQSVDYGGLQPQTLSQVYDGLQNLQVTESSPGSSSLLPQFQQGVHFAAAGTSTNIAIDQLDKNEHQDDKKNGAVGCDTFICPSGISIEEDFEEYMKFLANDDAYLHKEC